MATFTLDGYNSYSGCDIVVTATLPSINGNETSKKYYVLGSLQTLSISTHQDKRPVRSLGVINAKDYVMGPRTVAGSMVFAVFNKHFATEIMKDLGATKNSVILPDEIPALNITINFANEYGKMSRMAIYGVKIINEGQVMSINDLYTENTYQFVALGLEPLTEEVNENYNQNNLGSSDKVRIGNKDYVSDEDYKKDSGSEISKNIDNNLRNLRAIEDIVLSAKVIQPNSEYDEGIVVFTLAPNRNHGEIIISNKYALDEITKKVTIIDYTPISICMPIGDYYAKYINQEAERSNIISFSINNFTNNEKASKAITNYPIIENVTDKTITVLSNANHDTIAIFKSGAIPVYYNSNKNGVTITGLDPDTEYNIYTFNKNDEVFSRSEIITAFTFETKDEPLKLLNDFIVNNSNMHLTNVYSAFQTLTNNIEYNEELLIDYVLKAEDSDEKEELLVYANILQNQLVNSHNKDNEKTIINKLNNHPLDSVITLNGFDKAYVYQNTNNKSILIKTLNPEEENFYARQSTHYSIRGTKDSMKSPAQYFIINNKDAFDFLEPFTHVNSYKNLMIDDYLVEYRKNSYSSIEAIMIKENFYSDICILTPPYIYKQDRNILADVYYPSINKNKQFYLACIDIYSALDFCPARKIPFTAKDKTILLDNYFLGLKKGNKYLFWIEDENYYRISEPYIFVYGDSVDTNYIDSYYKKNLYKELTSIKNKLIDANTYNSKTLVSDLTDYIYSLNPSKKNAIDTLALELIKSFSESYYIGNTLDPLFDLLSIVHSSEERDFMTKATIDKNNRIVKIDCLEDCYICAIHFEQEDSVKNLDVYDGNKIVYPYSGFTMIYIITNNMLHKSDFLLIDNKRNIYKASRYFANLLKEAGE